MGERMTTRATYFGYRVEAFDLGPKRRRRVVLVRAGTLPQSRIKYRATRVVWVERRYEVHYADVCSAYPASLMKEEATWNTSN